MSTNEFIEPESLLKGLSETIRHRRKLLKISQEDLSSSAGFARGYLSDIERGARSFSIKNLARLSNVLKTSPSALLAMTERRLGGAATYGDTRLDPAILRALLCQDDSTLIIIDAKKADFPIVFVSKRFEKNFGYTIEEAMDRNFSFLLRGELYQDGLKTICKGIEIKTASFTQLKIYKKDGSESISDVSASPIVDDQGNVAYIVCLQKPVT